MRYSVLKRSFLKLAVIAFLILLLFNLIAQIGFPGRYERPPFRFFLAESDGNGVASKVGTVLNTSTCVVPNFDPFDESMAKYFLKDLNHCDPSAQPFFFVTEIVAGVGACPRLDMDVLRRHYPSLNLENLTCVYSEAVRETSADRPDAYHSLRPASNFEIGRCPPEENIFVYCSFGDGTFSYRQPMLLPKVRPAKPNAPLRNSTERYNVIVLGIDALSRLNFLRQMKKTRRWLERYRRNSVVEMFGYNKIGENSAPNQIPMMTGESYIPGMMDRAIGNYFDNISEYIWQAYSKQGFNTLFFEEQWSTGLFIHPSLQGFLHVPTDYWPRPIMQAADSSSSKYKGICFGPTYASKLYLSYLGDLLNVARLSSPLFAYAWFSELSHDALIGARRLDDDFEAFFEQLDAQQLLDETVILFLSDHGSRLEEWRGTEVGRYEDMLPFFYVMMPKQLLDRRPSISENLRVNSRRLTTVYDIHAMLEELTAPSGKSRRKTAPTATAAATTSSSDSGGIAGPITGTAPGYSLISEHIPEERTCLQAGINLQFCSCLKPLRISAESELAKQFARLVLDTANDEVVRNNATSLCAKWTLHEIYDFFQLRDPQHEFDVVKILLYAEPNNAMFEASAVYKGSQLSLNSRIERLDWYSGNARCVQDKPFARYCYCEENSRLDEPLL